MQPAALSKAGHTTKQYKKRLIQQRRQPWITGKHQWKPHRSGYQCHTCQTRVHQGRTVETIEARLQQECDQLTHEAPEPDISPEKPVGKKPTRASVIAGLLQVQQQHPITLDERAFQESKGYLSAASASWPFTNKPTKTPFAALLKGPALMPPTATSIRVTTPTHCGSEAKKSSAKAAGCEAIWMMRRG